MLEDRLLLAAVPQYLLALLHHQQSLPCFQVADLKRQICASDLRKVLVVAEHWRATLGWPW